MSNDNEKVAKIDLNKLQSLLPFGEMEDRVKVYQNFRLEAFNYLKQLELSVDQQSLNEIVGAANKFGRSALIFGGNELAKCCSELATRVSKNDFNVSRESLLTIIKEKNRLIKAIDDEVCHLKRNCS